jgi:hypothetical protein
MDYIIEKDTQVHDYKIENDFDALKIGSVYVGTVLEMKVRGYRKLHRGTFAYIKSLSDYDLLVNIDSGESFELGHCYFTLVEYKDWIKFPPKLQNINYEVLDESSSEYKKI